MVSPVVRNMLHFIHPLFVSVLCLHSLMKSPRHPIQAYEGMGGVMVSTSLCRFNVGNAATEIEAAR